MKIKKYYNTKNITYFKNGKWLHGDEAVKEMKLIKSDDGNWDLYLDESRNTIYYVAVKSGCNSGIWGNTRHYERIFKEKIPA